MIMRQDKFALYTQKHPSLALTTHTVEGLKYITELIPPLEYPKMLDIGCADGCETDVLHELGYDVIGITQGRVNVEYANRKYPNVRVFEMDMHDLEFDNATFDCIYTNHTYEHALAPFILLLEMYSVLRPGGLLFINVPNYTESADGSLYHHHPNMLPREIYRLYFNLLFLEHSVPGCQSSNCYLLEPKARNTLHSDVQGWFEGRKNMQILNR